MSDTSLRLAKGGLIDRSRPIRFRFDGREYTGFKGDTLASALWANGVTVAGTSFKYRRPRPPALSVDQPSALVQVGSGNRATPNTHPAAVALAEGLEAWSRNAPPFFRIDWAGPLMRPGFYYKRPFFRPTALWPLIERGLRWVASGSRPPVGADPDRYDRRFAETEVLIVGGGASGLREALIAAGRSSRVILVERSDRLGGSLIDAPETVDGVPAALWLASAEASLRRRPNVEILTDAVAVGLHDRGEVTVVERLSSGPHAQRLWDIQAERIIVATGAIDRPGVFSGNDKPGVTTLRAARAALARHALTVGLHPLIFTASDEGHVFARDLRNAGVEVAAVIDPRPAGPAAEATAARGIPLRVEHVVVRVLGRRGVRAAEVEALATDRSEPTRRPALIDTDAVIVGLGVRPALALLSDRAEFAWDDAAGAPVPTRPPERVSLAGDAAGVPGDDFPPLWWSPGCDEADAFIDPASDVTLADLRSSTDAGFVSIEHFKRWSAFGMGPDQGRSTAPTGAALLAGRVDRSPADIATFKERPPVVPVTVGAWGAADPRPLGPRRTALFEHHRDAGASFGVRNGFELPLAFPASGETVEAAIERETTAFDAGTVMFDVSDHESLEIVGPDAGALLDFAAAAPCSARPIGWSGPVALLREDGIPLGLVSVARRVEDRFTLLIPPARAERIREHIDFAAQVRRPELDVRTFATSGRRVAMALLGSAANDLAGSCRRLSLPGLGGRIVEAPRSQAIELWEGLAARGAVPVGAEAVERTRIRRGVPGTAEFDGKASLEDLGLGGMLIADGRDFIGARSTRLPAFRAVDRPRLVAVRASDGSPIPTGAVLVAAPGTPPATVLGHVTSIDGSRGLGFLRGDRAPGERTIIAASPALGKSVVVEIEILNGDSP